MAREGCDVREFSIKPEGSRMKTIFALQDRLIRTWFQAWEVQAATFSTIYARMPMIVAAATGFGDEHDHHETEVMVTEKLHAAQEGAHAGALETAKMTWKLLSGEFASRGDGGSHDGCGGGGDASGAPKSAGQCEKAGGALKSARRCGLLNRRLFGGGRGLDKPPFPFYKARALTPAVAASPGSSVGRACD